MEVARNIEYRLEMRTWEMWVGWKPTFIFLKQLHGIRLWIHVYTKDFNIERGPSIHAPSFPLYLMCH